MTTNSQHNSTGALRMKPVKKYAAPGYPSYAAAAANAGANPALLEKLPSRWQENAKVLACVGMVGTFTLAGCTTTKQTETNDPTIIKAGVVSESLARVKTHHGGFIGIYYVVYITEQEAFSTIQAEANAAGLRIKDEPSFNNGYWLGATRDTDMWYTLLMLSNKNEFKDEGILWGDFLKLLKEHAESQETPTP